MKKAWALTTKGFTIVELIVVIAVIGIIASIVSVTYINVQAGVRDGERKSDITRVKLAIEKYRADNSQYPAVCSNDNTGCAAVNLASALEPYLDAIPVDPTVSTPGSSTDYQYVRGTLAQDSYAIYIDYEAQPNCKTGKNMTPGWWSNAPICTNF
jgi:general secretion pathway protein G